LIDLLVRGRGLGVDRHVTLSSPVRTLCASVP